MKLTVNKLCYGLLSAGVALILPVTVDAAPCDCIESKAAVRQTERLARHHEMLPKPPGLFGLPAGAMPPPFAAPFPFLPPGLHLSEAQQDKLFELLHGQEVLVRQQQKAVFRAKQAIDRLATADHYSPEAMRPLAEKLATAIADTVLLRTATEVKIRALLTPEQRQQAEQMRTRMEAQSGCDAPNGRFFTQFYPLLLICC